MDKKIDKIKPGVNKLVLLFLAGSLWICVGTMLLVVSYSWLTPSHVDYAYVFGATGLALALLIHHFGFLRIVDKNLGRILPMEGKKCVFSFMPWKSYVLVAIMVATGVLLRGSSIPKPYLSILYIGIGFALILSSVRYLRVLLTKLPKDG